MHFHVRIIAYRHTVLSSTSLIRILATARVHPYSDRYAAHFVWGICRHIVMVYPSEVEHTTPLLDTF